MASIRRGRRISSIVGLPVDHFMIMARDEMEVLAGLELEKAAKKLLKANMTLTQEFFLL